MPKGFGKSSNNDQIDIESLVAHRNGQPYVRLKWGKNTAQLTAKEAIDHATGIIQVAVAATIDAQIFEWATTKINSSPEQASGLLRLFRLKRQAAKLPSLTINIDGEPMRADAIRESACQMIEMTFGAEAEAYLVGFLLEELQLEPGQVDLIVQEFREMRGATTLWSTEEDDRE